MEIGPDSRGETQSCENDVLDRRIYEREPPTTHFDGVIIEQVNHYRQVMWFEIPQGVGVASDTAETQPTRVGCLWLALSLCPLPESMIPTR